MTLKGETDRRFPPKFPVKTTAKLVRAQRSFLFLFLMRSAPFPILYYNSFGSKLADTLLQNCLFHPLFVFIFLFFGS